MQQKVAIFRVGNRSIIWQTCKSTLGDLIDKNQNLELELKKTYIIWSLWPGKEQYDFGSKFNWDLTRFLEAFPFFSWKAQSAHPFRNNDGLHSPIEPTVSLINFSAATVGQPKVFQLK